MHLTDQQRDAVRQDSHVCLVSCPGSGKTRAIVAKLLHCIESVRGTMRRVACITHTNAAAEEVDSRLRQLCFGDEDNYYEVSTIHAFALQNVLQPFHHYLPELQRGFTVLTSDCEIYISEANALIRRFNLRPRHFDEFERIHRNPDGTVYALESLPARLQIDWCAWLDHNAFVTFNDMLYHAGRLVSLHNHISSAIASRFAWMLVDEFQDSSAGQILILKEIHRFGRTRFFCVGDPNQSIYRFAGASPELLPQFAAHVAANTQHRLTGNFRSSRRIIAVAERLCPTSPQMKAVGVHADVAIDPVHRTVASPIEGILSHFLPTVRELNIPLGQVAVLAAWWISLFHLGRQLRRHGIPAIGPGARPYRRNHILAPLLEALGAYSESAEPELALVVQRALFVLLTNITEQPAHSAFDYRGRILVCRLLAEAQAARTSSALAVDWIVDVAERVARVLVESDYLPPSAVLSIAESAGSMVADVRGREGGDGITTADIGIFARPRDCLHLLTIHKAKGHEFEAVAVIDAHDGRLPHFSVSGIPDPLERQAQYDEFRRVVYVAATRAKRVLMFFTDTSDPRNNPSPFLGEMQLF